YYSLVLLSADLFIYFFFFQFYAAHRDLHSFPTRRSSDLPLVSENLGVERLPIEVKEDGLKHSVRIGEAIDFEVEDVVPVGVETGEPAKLTGIFHPAGSELTVAHATRSKINAFGIQYEGKSGFSNRQFSWSP